MDKLYIYIIYKNFFPAIDVLKKILNVMVFLFIKNSNISYFFLGLLAIFIIGYSLFRATTSCCSNPTLVDLKF